MGRAAAQFGAQLLREALAQRGVATVVVATGASQLEMFAALVTQPQIDWSRITGFHLDEYLGLDADHGASFCGYLRKRFVEQVSLAAFHYIDGRSSPEVECQRLSDLIRRTTVDVAFVGIGENGHLAFNDPPADFETDAPYHVVQLDAACRQQQAGEGWFATPDLVPRQAISMSIREILRARRIVCTVPDARKAVAVQRSLEGPVTADVPASILQRHPGVDVFLDMASAQRLGAEDHA